MSRKIRRYLVFIGALLIGVKSDKKHQENRYPETLLPYMLTGILLMVIVAGCALLMVKLVVLSVPA